MLLHLLPDASVAVAASPCCCCRQGTLKTARFLESVSGKQTAAPIWYTKLCPENKGLKPVPGPGRATATVLGGARAGSGRDSCCSVTQISIGPCHAGGQVGFRPEHAQSGEHEACTAGDVMPSSPATDASARSHGSASGWRHPREPTTVGSLLVTDGQVSTSLTERA